MTILDKLLAGGRRTQALRAPRLARHAAEYTSIDEWMLDDLKQQSPAFAQALETPITYGDGEVYEPSADIHDDIFLGAHTPGESRVKDSEDVRPSHRFGRDVLEAFFDTDAHKDAKPTTEASAIASAIYTRAAIQAFDELMSNRAVQEHLEQSQQQHEDEQQLEDVRQQLEEARERAKDIADQGNGPGDIPGDLKDEIKDLTRARELLVDAIADAPGPPSPLPTPVQQAIEQAAGDGKDRAELWGNLQGFANGALDRATPDEAWDMAEAWMQLTDFQELVKLIGRVVRDFRTQDAKNVIGGDDEIIGVERGNNLTRTLPIELARLADPLLQRGFLRDYVDEDLLQLQTQGSEKIALGPGVLCMDASSSMNSASGSGRAKMLEAKAVIVGYVRLMHKKKRDAAVIVFNGSVMAEHFFPKNQPLDMKAVLDIAKLRGTGGTNITTSVVRAEEYIKRAQPFKRADVLVVTDGEDNSFNSTTEGVKSRFAQAGVRTMGISIGPDPQPGGWLLKFCDHAIGVNALTEATADIVRGVS